MTNPVETPNAVHGCIIMASGLSTRFGSNKLMADLDGAPLIAHATSACDGLFAKRVAVTRHKDVAKLCCTLGVEAIMHDEPLRSDTICPVVSICASSQTAALPMTMISIRFGMPKRGCV